MARAKPRIAVWKFASCDGCQLSLLDCEDELLALGAEVTFVHFPEAGPVGPEGPFDLSLVEGSVSVPEHLERVEAIRKASHRLIPFGACATAGGIQALRNFADWEAFRSIVYARPDYIETLATSTPISAHVAVDLELPGCPIDKRQLLGVIEAILNGRAPASGVPGESVCTECKRRGTPCVMVRAGTPCLGPVTQAGCGALCPAYNRGCYGCFGPMETPNTAALAPQLRACGLSAAQIRRIYATFNAAAPGFREEGAGR